MSAEEKWFSARILLESLHPEEENVEKVFEDRVIVLRAASEAAAQEKAQRLGRESREEYKNVYGKQVIWEFREVLNVLELFDDPIEDGTEVYWAFLFGDEEVDQVKRLMQPRPEDD